MKRKSPTATARTRAQGAAKGAHLSLTEAAQLIGMDPADLAGSIREAGLAPAGPEAEWRLEAADVMRLGAERAKAEQRNLRELEKAARQLE